MVRIHHKKWCWIGSMLTGMMLAVMPTLVFAGDILMYFPSDWKEKSAKAKEIADVMAKSSGLDLKPRVVGSQPELIEAFVKKEAAVVYVGSLVSTILNSRDLATPLVQGITGKELYESSEKSSFWSSWFLPSDLHQMRGILV